MFANFELWSGGLLEKPAKIPQTRSSQGCIPCRRVKKKCDEQKPICGRCNHRSRQECVWDPVSLSGSRKLPTRSLQNSRHAASLSLSSKDGTCLAVIGKETESLQRPYIPQSLHTSFSSVLTLPDMPGLPSHCISDLVQLGNHVVHGVYFDDRYTLLKFNLPLFSHSPPLLYAWLSLSAMHAAQRQPDSNSSPWLRIALYFHSKAVNGLAEHLTSLRVISDEVLCSIILLHVYEKLGDDFKPPSFAHIATARDIFMNRFTSSPESLYQVLQIDCLVYRLAVISTFHATVQTHYESVSELVELSTSSHFDDYGMWRHSLWASVPLAMYDTVFKLSFLLRRLPLNTEWTAKLDQIETGLTSPDQAVALQTPEHDADKAAQLAKQAFLAYSIYYYACLIIVAKLRDIEATPSSAKVQAAYSPGLRILHHLQNFNFVSPVMIWPASIIGLAAQSPADRLIIRDYIKRLAPNTGLKTISSILHLLDHAWQPDHGEMGGLDILINEQILSHVFV